MLRLSRGTCIKNPLMVVYVGSGLNIILDLIVFALPIPKILGLQLCIHKKIGTCMVFLVGLFVTVCSIVRLYFVVRWRASQNPTWNNSPVGTWSLIEIDVGIICACMPALSGRLRKLWMATIGKHISALYHAGRERSTTPEEIDIQRNNGCWRPPSWTGSGKLGADAIVRNVSIKVSDEMELMNKDSGIEFAGSSRENLWR